MTIRIAEGHFGRVRLDGAKVGLAFSWPAAMHEGNGTLQVLFDAGATPEQRDALAAIVSGAHGGRIFEIFSVIAPNRPAPLVVPMRIEADRETRTARISLSGVVEYEAEPIRNPVTGEEHRAQIHLPGGFEYRMAEVANSVRLHVQTGPLRFEHRNTYAQFNEFNWGNN